MKFFNTILLILLFGSIAVAQNGVIRGLIINEDNQRLAGATILIAGTQDGTITDLDGVFELNNLSIGQDYSLVISYVGYRDYKITVPAKAKDNQDKLTIKVNSQSYVFEALTVKATRVADDAPFAYSNISKEEIEKNNLGQDVPYLLQWSPSTVVNSDAGTGIGYTGIRIRGIEPAGINVTINGIPLNDSESQGVFWVDLPDFSTSTSSIQIQRGVGTSTNGAGAFGASINLNTSAPDPIAFTELNGTIGSFGTLKGNVNFGTGMLNEKLSFEGRLSTITSDGYVDRASVDLNSYFLSGTYHGKRSTLSLNAFSGHEVTYQAWNGLPVQWENDENLRTYNSAGTNRPGEPHDNEVDDYTQSHYQLLYNRELSSNIRMSIAGHYTRGLGFFELYEAGESLEDFALEPIVINDSFTITETDLIQRRWLDNHFYGGTFNLNYRSKNKTLQTILGGAWNQYIGDHYGEVLWARNTSTSEQNHRYYDNTGEKMDYNVYLKNTIKIFEGLNAFVDLQYRAIDYSIEGIDKTRRDISQSHNYEFFNPKAGLTYQTKNNLQIYGSYAIANREPNRSDFTDAGDADNNGIPDVPSHETLSDAELGVRITKKNWALNTNFYFMDYENALIPTGQINDVGEYVRANVADSYRAGVEFATGVRMSDFFEINANATYSQNKVTSFTEYIDNWDTWGQETVEHKDTDLAFSPEVISGVELTYHALPNVKNQDLNLAILGKYVGKQYLDNTSNDNASLDAYWFSNIRLGYTIRPKKVVKEIALNILLRNVTGEQYSSSGWIYRFRSPSYNPVGDDPYARVENGDGQYNLTGLYPQAGRNILVGLKVRF